MRPGVARDTSQPSSASETRAIKCAAKFHNYFWPGAGELSDGAIDFGDLPSSLVGKFSISVFASPINLVIVIVDIY